MPFFLLILLALIYMQGQWPEPPLGVSLSGSLLVTAVGLGVFVLLAAVLSLRLRLALRRDEGHANYHVRHFSFWRRWHFFGLLIYFGVSLYALGWGHATKNLQADRFIPGFELLTLGPLLAAMVFSWVFFYDADRAIQHMGVADGNHYPSRWAYVLLNIRNNLILIVPPMMLMTLQRSLLYFIPELADQKETSASHVAVLVAFLALGMILIPLVYRVFLGLRPLPDGPLRERLTATAQRLNFRFADILLWNTRNAMANAMVTGAFPWLRYVVVTDRLIDQLDPDEIEAVFGHEVGHIKHRHMTFYIWFLLTSIVILGHAWTAATNALGETFPNEVWLTNVTEPVFLVLIVSYIFVAFGFLSRRCERQADLFGCRTTTPSAFASALDKVAYLNGISKDKPGWLSSWQHSTIGRRIAFVLAVESDPHLETTFQRRLHWLRWATICILTTGAALAVWSSGADSLRHL
ncbi:MAG: M48 family metalloprotease [Gemmataceae bacterium]|nr:M48 family metalloprotease [Gemmataceae bacterium]